MNNLEDKIAEESKEIVYFKQMITGAERLISPWKFALILTNAFWAVVLALFICFAYLTPTEMEQTQDFPAQQQEQNYKG